MDFDLLAQNPHEAVIQRRAQLEDHAQSARCEIEATKGSAIALALVGNVMATPLGMALGAVGLGCYAASMVLDHRHSHHWFPIPFVRQGVGELLSRLGSGDDDENRQDPSDAVTAFLCPTEADEYRLLYWQDRALVGMLMGFPSEQRRELYILCLHEWRKHRRLPESSEARREVVYGGEVVAVGKGRQSLPAHDSTPLFAATPYCLPEMQPEAIAVAFQPASPVPVAQPTAPVPVTTPVPDLDENRDRLLRALKAHEGGWILKTMKRPVFIHGEQRSRKTSLAVAIALTRYLLLNHRLVACSPHRVDEGAFPPVFTVYGLGGRWDQIRAQMVAYHNRISSGGTGEPITCIWDELSTYTENLEPSVTSTLVRSLLSESTKHEEYPLLVAHGNTNAFWGGADGTATARKRGFVTIERLSDSDVFGEALPRQDVLVENLSRDSKIARCTVPDWFSPANLTAWFPELAAQPAANLDDALEQLRSLTTEVGGSLSVRVAQQRRLLGLKAEGIRALFADAHRAGLGRVENDTFVLT
jgi:hypothetical protein